MNTTQTETTKTASPAKLRDGSWGAKVHGSVEIGDKVEVVTSGGKRWNATVSRIVWRGEGVTIFATSTEPRAKTATATQATQRGECAECGRYGALRPARDSSGITAGCCGRCASRPSWDLSFA